MPKVTFLPLGITCEAETGERILDIAINNDVPIQHACGGCCSCTTCHIQLKTTKDSLIPMEEEENETLEFCDERTETSRLACQSVLGKEDVVVEIFNLD